MAMTREETIIEHEERRRFATDKRDHDCVACREARCVQEIVAVGDVLLFIHFDMERDMQ